VSLRFTGIVRKLAVLLSLLLLPAASRAAGLVEFVDGVIPEAPPNAAVMAGYGRIRNATDGPVRIYAAASPDFERVEFHRTTMEDGVMRMQKLGGFAVPVGGWLEFQRGGMHLMLIGPRRALHAGDLVQVEFSYAAPAPIKATFEVRREVPREGSD